MTKTVLSYGAGVNTFAMLLKLPEWRIKPDYVIFADTGNENPKTYEHLKRVQIPEMERQGLRFITVKHPKWSSLLEYSLETRKMPPRNKFRGQGRYCTTMFKLDPIIRFETSVREGKESFVNLIGIAYDEIHRMSKVGRRKWIANEHPLIDHKITRADCATIIRLAGFEIPPKSGCDFCPFQRKSQWAKAERDNPTAIDDGIMDSVPSPWWRGRVSHSLGGLSRLVWSSLGTILEVVGLGVFFVLFLYMAHLRLDIDQIPSDFVLITWLFGLVLVAVGVVLNHFGESLPQEELPQESAGA